MRWWKFFSILALGVGATGSVQAQQSISGMAQQIQSNGALLQFMLLDQPSVQQELQLTPEQTQQLKELGTQEKNRLMSLRQQPSMEATMQQVREAQASTEKTLLRVLSNSQMQRLKQIGYQQMGGLSLSRPEVADTVGLDDAQRAEVQRLQVELFQTMEQQIPRGGPGLLRPGAIQQKINEVRTTFDQNRKAAGEKAVALLSTEQRTKWVELQGEPFRGELSMQNSPFFGSLQQQGGLGGGLRGRLRNR